MEQAVRLGEISWWPCVYPYQHQFVLNPRILNDHQVRYDLDRNPQHWPWLVLPADHPALIGKYSFFIGIGCGLHLLKLSPDTASALTQVSWQNQPACFGTALPVAALAEISRDAEKFAYRCDLLDEHDNVMQRMQARGVVFAHRDYGGWRNKIKQTLERTRPQDFNFAEPDIAGVSTPVACFVSPLHEGREGLACYALVDAKAGFVPGHPWHTGTGDHVNASQLLDATLQAAHLVANAQGWSVSGGVLACLGGEAAFLKYVELGSPFEIRLMAWKPLENGRGLRFALRQSARTCADIMLELSVVS